MRMEDIQQEVDRIRNIACTQPGHWDTALAVDTVDDPEMDMKSVLEQEGQRLDTGLVLEECRKVESRYILPCFPCLSLQLCSYEVFC